VKDPVLFSEEIYHRLKKTKEYEREQRLSADVE